MQLVIEPGGVIRCVYDETIDLNALGNPVISRASYVEPDEQGRWWADMGPVGGGSLGPFPSRTEALASEQRWLAQNWIGVLKGWFTVLPT